MGFHGVRLASMGFWFGVMGFRLGLNGVWFGLHLILGGLRAGGLGFRV